jgi:hypothetical protein
VPSPEPRSDAFTDARGAESVTARDRGAAARPDGEPVFAWKDHGRFVELHAVRTGWLVLWGRYGDLGRTKNLVGNRTYTDLAGARRRLADAVVELTRRRSLAAEAVSLLDRTPLPDHRAVPPPDPL